MKFNLTDYLSTLDNQVFGKQILYIPETKSTNDDIWNHFVDNDHLIVVTDKQTAGRGQRGNKWVSKEYQSLTFSIGLLDDKKNSDLLSLKCAIAISNAIKKITGISVSTKWPNDILIKNKKISGILIESKVNNNRRILNIGIGINVNFDIDDVDTDLKDKMTSLKIEARQDFSRELILSECIKSIDSLLYKNNQFIITEWTKLCAHNNSELTFHDFNNKIIKGKFMGVDKKGRAIILSNGETNYYFNGAIKL